MTFIRTVLGDKDPADLGPTNAHDHLFMLGGLPVMKEPDFRLNDLDKAVAEIELFRAAGGTALLDALPLDCGRSPSRLIEVARRTGAHIIASTGFHVPGFYDDLHWIHHYSIEQLVELEVGEIEQGLDEWGGNGPFPQRLDAKAGAIKIATDYQKIAPVSEKLMEAAVVAHRATGAPIFTHTEMGTMGLEQAERMISLGADPRHIIIGHMDRNPDVALHRAVAETGVFLQYDTPGRVKYQPESTVVELIGNMMAAGFGGHILLGGDNARRSSWRAFGGGPGIAYILDRFIPRLYAEGHDRTAVDALIIDNPARAFQFAEKQA